MQYNIRLLIIRTVIINLDFKRPEFSRLSSGRVLINQSAQVHTKHYRTTGNENIKKHKYV